jgi:GntR family transcriptional regulator/MocR family aminotransferase
MGPRVELTGDAAGAHVVLWPRARVDERNIIERARALGVGVYGLAPYYVGRAPRPGFMLGYSRLTEQQIEQGIRRLATLV